MKDKILYLPTAIIGIIFVVYYGYKCWKNKKSINVATAVGIILQSAGVVAGTLLIASTFYEELRNKLSGIDLYVLISGIAVFVVSLQGLWREVAGENKVDKQSGV